MRERIESKHVTKEIKSQMPVIPVEIVKERGCTFCPYYLGNYEKQPRCMMKTCAWDDENERFHPVLRELIPYYKEKMDNGRDRFETDINHKTGRKLSVHFELYEGAWISADSSGIWKTDRSKINVICFFQN